MIELNSVCLNYGTQSILENLSMHIAPGEKLALMGPSGCGKTSLLRIISGLHRPDSGSVRVNGCVSCIFQEPRLLPWLSALDNVNSVLSDSPATLDEARLWLERLELADASGKLPHELSGGMQQRLSIARALAYGGDILLADEPLKGMDRDLRRRVAELIRSSCVNKTLLLVTHERSEAEVLADRLFVYRDKNFIEE